MQTLGRPSHLAIHSEGRSCFHPRWCLLLTAAWHKELRHKRPSWHALLIALEVSVFFYSFVIIIITLYQTATSQILTPTTQVIMGCTLSTFAGLLMRGLCRQRHQGSVGCYMQCWHRLLCCDEHLGSLMVTGGGCSVMTILNTTEPDAPV